VRLSFQKTSAETAKLANST